MKSLEVKTAYLDENYKILERNKDFYSYFEKIGFLYSNIEDIVLPAQKQDFLNFVKTNRDHKNFNAYQFKKITGEYFFNIVSVGYEKFNGREYLSVDLIDISNALGFFKESSLYEKKMNYVLSITGDYFFSYQKSTNIFKMHNFIQNENHVLYEQDIDCWKEQVIREALVADTDIENFEDAVQKFKSCQPSFSVTVNCALRSQQKIFEQLSFKAVRMEDGGEVYMIGQMAPESFFEQVGKTTELLQELKIDSLTGVYNKKTITNFAEKRFVPGTKENAMLAIVDLDHFKPVNDAYGHMAGDKVLAQAGKILKNIVGEDGIVGRYGGDEFLLILEDMNDESTFRGVFHSINSDIRVAFENMFTDIKVTASIGASMYPKDGDSLDELFKKADFCLYRAKDKGRDRYVFFRDDLHGELYRKATAAKTEGIKYDVREVRELKSMADFLLNLRTQSKEAIETVLSHMLKTYNLDAINIYHCKDGKNMDRVYCLGKEKDSLKKADYVFGTEFSDALNGKAFIRVDFTTELTPNALAFGKVLEARGVKSTIHCILGTNERILGLITFDRLKESALWAEYEVNCCVMFAAALNLFSEESLFDLFA